MRISDWSSDVCSSDLIAFFKGITPVTHQIEHDLLDLCSVAQRRRPPFRQLHMGADALGLCADQGKSGSLLDDGTNILECTIGRFASGQDRTSTRLNSSP